MTASVLACSSGGSGNSDAGPEDVGFDLNPGGCPEGTRTTISGTIVSPAKIKPDPIYNAVAFIPASTPQPFTKRVSCERCGTLQGSKAKSIFLTGPDGKFVLENVPTGRKIPFVVQIGRWRRQVLLPEIKPCVDNPLDPELYTRLPRNRDDGDIPLTALVAGSADSLECVLRKMGIDDGEFGLPLEGGSKSVKRIHMFKALSGPLIGSGSVSGKSLWSDPSWLKDYDVVLLPCEGAPRTDDKTDYMKNLVDYTGIGGRVFGTHYSYVWMLQSPVTSWKNIASWAPDTDGPASLLGYVDTSFPKGKAMADWLKLVGASKDLGIINIEGARYDATIAHAPAQQWITSKAPTSLQHFTYNTPVDKKPEDQCGRVVYSDFHVVNADTNGTVFPAECTDTGPLTAQERVLEFMLFDLASCVQKDDATPVIPQ